jgi:hypothetical protein
MPESFEHWFYLKHSKNPFFIDEEAQEELTKSKKE